MERRDPELLAAWCRTAAGQEDEPAAQALLERLSPGDSASPRHARGSRACAACSPPEYGRSAVCVH